MRQSERVSERSQSLWAVGQGRLDSKVRANQSRRRGGTHTNQSGCLGATNLVGGWEPQTRSTWGRRRGEQGRWERGSSHLGTANLGLEVREHPSGKGSLPSSLASVLPMGKLKLTEGKRPMCC